MLRSRRRACVLALVGLLAIVTSACSNADDSRGTGGSSNGTSLSGTVSGDGSSTVFPITEAIAEEFQKENSQVQVTVGSSGTGGGFEKFCGGQTDLQNASRPIKDSEKQACQAAGVEYVELTVANDGLAILVNKSNTWAGCLTVEELKKVWAPASTVNDWKDIKAGFPSKPLKLYGPGTDSGTFDFFTEKINGKEDLSRSDFVASEDDNTLVQGVEGDEGALGYFGFAYYSENKESLKLLGVDSGGGCIKPSDETVKSGTYKPLSRPLFLYVKKASVSRPELKAFVDFYLDNVNKILPDVGYTPLAASVLKTERDEFDASVGG